MSTPALVVVSHGSPERQANEAFLALVRTLKGRNPGWRVEGGFLERARPPLVEVLSDVLAAGCAPAAVVPCFLFPGGHAGEDIPAQIAQAKRQWPAADVRYGRTLGEHPDVAAILSDAVPVDALAAPASRIVLVAAGSVAVENREAVQRMTDAVRRTTGLSTRFGYLDHGDPLIGPVLEDAVQGRPPFLVILPCLLFPGLYLRTLGRLVDGFRAAHRGMNIRLGESFGGDPRLAGILEAEAKRVLA